MALPRIKFGDFASAMVETARTRSLIFAIVRGRPHLRALSWLHWHARGNRQSQCPLGVAPTLVLIGIRIPYSGMFIDGIGMVLLMGRDLAAGPQARNRPSGGKRSVR